MNARPWVLSAIALLLALDAHAVAPQQDAGRGQQAPSFRSGVLEP